MRVAQSSILRILFFGFLGGLGTVFGKIAFSSESLVLVRFLAQCHALFPSAAESAAFSCSYGVYLVRFLAFAGIFACNAIGLGIYLKAMEQNNTIVVVVVSSATNFLTTGLLGRLVFGELLSSSWYLGSSLVMVGMIFVAMSQGSTQTASPQGSKRAVVVD